LAGGLAHDPVLPRAQATGWARRVWGVSVMVWPAGMWKPRATRDLSPSTGERPPPFPHASPEQTSLLRHCETAHAGEAIQRAARAGANRTGLLPASAQPRGRNDDHAR